jgi:CRISPR/Cas system CMR-associated protein Cmr1 (group 7 of RAMP superfamily)
MYSRFCLLNIITKCQKNEQLWTESACILDVLKELQGYIKGINGENEVEIPSIVPNEYLTFSLGNKPFRVLRSYF